MIAGALVTSNDAALSVPDWPLSFGTMTPPMVGGICYEHSHRVIAGGLGVLTIVLAILIWVKDERRWLRWFGLIAVGGVIAQGVLGRQVVLQLLHYWLPVMHACFAQIMFAAVVSIAVFTSQWWMSERPQLEDRGSPSIHSAGDSECRGDLSVRWCSERVSGIKTFRSGRTSPARWWCSGWSFGRRSCLRKRFENVARNCPRRGFCCTPSSACSFCWASARTGRD